MPFRAQPRDPFPQHGQRFRMGVANGERKAVVPGQPFQPTQLRPDRGGADFAIVEKDVPPRGVETIVARHLLGDRAAIGATVDEIEMAVGAQHLHQPAHLLGVSGQQAAHVIVQAGNAGKAGQRIDDGMLERGLVHAGAQHHGLQPVAAVLRLHRHVKHDFAPHAPQRDGELLAVGGIGENGERDGGVEPRRPEATIEAVADVIDDQCDDARLQWRGHQPQNDQHVETLAHPRSSPAVPLPSGIGPKAQPVSFLVTTQLTPEIRHFCVRKWSFTLVNSHFLP